MRSCVMVGLLASAVLAAADPAPSLAAGFPFVFHDGLLWVQIQVPLSDRLLNFLLDSGAGASVLNTATARRLGIPSGEPVAVHGVHSQTVGYWSPRLTATVGDLRLRQRFLVVDLNELGRDCRCAVDGLLGADFFHRRVVQLDFNAQTVRLLRSSAPTSTSEVLPLRSHRGVLLLQIRVNGGEAQWVRLDTGCASALEWVFSGHRPADTVPRISIGLAEVSIPTALTMVELGRCRFDGVSTGLHEPRIFPAESGLLGNGLLSRFVVTVDAPAGRLILDRRGGW